MNKNSVIEYGCGHKVIVPMTEELVEQLHHNPTLFLDDICTECEELHEKLQMQKSGEEFDEWVDEMESEIGRRHYISLEDERLLEAWHGC